MIVREMCSHSELPTHLTLVKGTMINFFSTIGKRGFNRFFLRLTIYVIARTRRSTLMESFG